MQRLKHLTWNARVGAIVFKALVRTVVRVDFGTSRHQ